MTSRKLVLIKSVHTLVWVFYNVVIFYLLYAVLTNRIDYWVWICIGLVVLEGMILLIFRWFCPLTLLARRYSTSTRENFDIYLPQWLAKYNKVIYTTLFGIAMLVLIYQLMR